MIPMSQDDQNKAMNNLAYALRKMKYLEDLENGTGAMMPVNDEQLTWFEEYFKAHPEQNLYPDALKEMETMAMLSWFELACYLREQVRNGKTEFRLSLTGDRTFNIRPFGKNVKCLDIKV